MKTEYKILWIDNELGTVESDIEDLKDFFDKRGIFANIQTVLADDDSDIHDKIQGVLQDEDLDLIVVDFLMDDVDGSQLIRQIRESDHIFLPVVFYSSVGPKELHKQAAEASLDGVYIAERDRVRQKVEQVAKSLLVKEQTTKRTRGLLMEGTSEVDAKFQSLFELLWQQLDDDGKNALIAYTQEKVDDGLQRATAVRKAIPETPDEFFEHMQADFVSPKYEALARWKILKRAFSLLSREDDQVQKFTELYDRQGNKPSLMPLRNRYAHQTRSQLAASHNEDVCYEIRREIRAHLTNIAELLGEI